MNDDAPNTNQAGPASTPNSVAPPPSSSTPPPSQISSATPPAASPQMPNSFGPANQGLKKAPNNKLIMMVIAVVVILLIVGSSLYLFLGRSGTVACTSSSCFDSHFANCTPATWSSTSAIGGVKYQTISKASSGCKMTFQYTANLNSSWDNKPMTCDFDNTKSLDNSVNAVVGNLASKHNSYHCSGPLVSILQNLG